jgi:hypothetical protein
MRPNIGECNAETGEYIEREMTDEEYADLIQSGWTPAAPEPEPETEDGTP